MKKPCHAHYFESRTEQKLIKYEVDGFAYIMGTCHYERPLSDFEYEDFKPWYLYENGKSYGYYQLESFLTVLYKDGQTKSFKEGDIFWFSKDIKSILYYRNVYDSWSSREHSDYGFTVTFK